MKKFLEKEDRKWFNDKVIVVSFGGDKEEETKLKKIIEDKFIKEQKKRSDIYICPVCDSKCPMCDDEYQCFECEKLEKEKNKNE
tara:strand:+ start:264 stop:515 length:252 start_codon:yes stop_codon:yes gene_type:complete